MPSIKSRSVKGRAVRDVRIVRSRRIIRIPRRTESDAAERREHRKLEPPAA